MLRRREIGRQSGVTLMEIAALFAIVAFLAIIFLPRLPSTNLVALQAQASTLVANLRRAQTLATTLGKSVCLQRMTGSAVTEYAIYDTSGSGGSLQCLATRMQDPITGRDLMVTLEQGTTLSGSTNVIFNSLGKTTAAATFYLSADNRYRTITVDPLTGWVSLSSSDLPLPLPQVQP